MQGETIRGQGNQLLGVFIPILCLSVTLPTAFAASLGPLPDLVVDGTSYFYDAEEDGDFGQWFNTHVNKSDIRITVRGDHLTIVGLDLTGFRKGTILDARELRLTCRSMPACVDRTDSRGIEVWGGRFIGDPDYPPAVGILDARDLSRDSRSAGTHVNVNTTVVGDFSKAAYVNIGSESNTWLRPRIENRTGSFIWMLETNSRGVASDFGNPGNTASATSQTFAALRTKTSGRHAEPGIIVEGFDRITFSGHSQFYSHSGVPIVLDASRNAIAGFNVQDGWLVGGGVGVKMLTSPNTEIMGVRINLTKASGREMTCIYAHSGGGTLYNVELITLDAKENFCFEDDTQFSGHNVLWGRDEYLIR